MENTIVREIQSHHSAPKTSSTSRSTQAEQNPVLSRLLDEVRNERDFAASYDRVHNRHNRAGGRV